MRSLFHCIDFYVAITEYGQVSRAKFAGLL